MGLEVDELTFATHLESVRPLSSTDALALARLGRPGFTRWAERGWTAAAKQDVR